MPIFFNEYKKPLVSGGLMKHLKSLVYLYNSNILYTKSAKSLLHTLKTNKNFTTPKLSFCKETFDVWFVSGNSYLTLNKKGNLTYIEGNDQHRGWFQSSLWLGLLYKNYIPYNKLTTHGFIVDKGGLKFSKSSKSKKNKLFYIMENYGSDLLKLWFCSENPYNDIFFSEKILNKAVSTYRMFRNTFKFMLGNLFDLNIYKDKLSYSLLKKRDRFFLHKTFTHIKSFFS
jgi:isoleucyl-tRNA synthetase